MEDHEKHWLVFRAATGLVRALRESLTGMAEKLQKNARPWQGGGRVFYPEDYGCRAGEMATEAIQRALDAAGKSGGTVRLRKGDYVSGTL